MSLNKTNIQTFDLWPLRFTFRIPIKRHIGRYSGATPGTAVNFFFFFLKRFVWVGVVLLQNTNHALMLERGFLFPIVKTRANVGMWSNMWKEYNLITTVSGVYMFLSISVVSKLIPKAKKFRVNCHIKYWKMLYKC